MISDNKAIVRRIHDQLNQGHFEIVDELYVPDYVSHIGEWTYHILGRLAPTHRAVKTSRMIIRRFQDGKVKESWVNADHLGMLHQTGVIGK